MDRRTFLAMMAVTAAPSDQLVMGVIQRHADVKVGAICDVYEPNLEKAFCQVRGLAEQTWSHNWLKLLKSVKIKNLQVLT